MSRDSFIFYRSFYEVIQDLNKDDKLQLINAICELSLNDNKIELEGITKILFKVIEPQLQANNDRYNNGKKGGRPKNKTIGSEKETSGFGGQKTSGFENKKANNNVNDNVNENVNANDNETVNKNDIWLEQFEEFYGKYPKKVKKQKVLEWFEKNKPNSELFSSMLSSLEQFKGTEEWKKEKGQFIPYPITWLNQKRWEDETIAQEPEDDKSVEYKPVRADELTEEEYIKLLRGG